MYIDPIIIDFLTGFVLPILLAVVVLYSTGMRRRTPHPMLLAVIGELVLKDIFDADSLLRIGVLKPEPEPSMSPVELIKLLRGGA